MGLCYGLNPRLWSGLSGLNSDFFPTDVILLHQSVHIVLVFSGTPFTN